MRLDESPSGAPLLYLYLPTEIQISVQYALPSYVQLQGLVAHAVISSKFSI